MGRKPTLTDFNILDHETLKKEFTSGQLIELLDDLLEAQLTLIGQFADNVGIRMSYTGSINPKHYKTQGQLGGGIGLKVWVYE